MDKIGILSFTQVTEKVNGKVFSTGCSRIVTRSLGGEVVENFG